MLFLWLLCSLASLGWVCAVNNCSYQSLLDHLGLAVASNSTLKAIRPTRDWRTPTLVQADIYLYSIVEVNEKAQSFSTRILLPVFWNNDFLKWNPSDFCGIKEISIPKERLWMPDLTIRENIETEGGMGECPNAMVQYTGGLNTGSSYRMTSACKMDLYTFPFDTQHCNLTLISFVHQMSQMHLVSFSNSAGVTAASQQNFQNGGEWELISMKVAAANHTVVGMVWEQLVYTVIMKRRPLMYMINFLLPVLYFLLLDLASFFMTEEKLAFKVTLLLAISVLLLLLNDLLPSTAESIPLIGVYCCSIFSFTAISILETILVEALKSRDGRGDAEPLTSVKTPEERVDNAGRQEDCGGELLCCAGWLQVIRAKLQTPWSRRSPTDQGHGERKPVCWRTVARRIDITFFCCYLASVIVFLVLIGVMWFP